MHKLFSILLSAALLLPILAGCQNSYDVQKRTATPLPIETITPSTVPAAKCITPDQAKAIALQDAQLQESDVHDLEVELDRDGRIAHYDVDFEKDRCDYEYEIDAISGEILNSKKEKD